MNLIQEGTPDIEYTWSWGDNSVDISYRYERHTYYLPGLYTLSVTAAEDDESINIQRSITVLGNNIITLWELKIT